MDNDFLGKNPCELPLILGNGRGALSRYYFDISTSSCKHFIYTGMKGNENNFASLIDCKRTCPGINIYFKFFRKSKLLILETFFSVRS